MTQEGVNHGALREGHGSRVKGDMLMVKSHTNVLTVKEIFHGIQITVTVLWADY